MSSKTNAASARVPRRAATGGDMTARIEEAAMRLFIQHGYNGVSYLDIAKELGVTHPSIHYHYRTKALLAEAVLRRAVDATLEAMKLIWTDPATSLVDKFVGARNWIHGQYLVFNPGGKGGRPWGLLGRFTLEADALTSTMRRTLRTALDRLEDHIATGVRIAVERGELEADAPQAGIVLLIASLMSVTGQATRHGSGFDRLHELMRITSLAIARAWGTRLLRAHPWPDLPGDRPPSRRSRDTREPAANRTRPESTIELS